MVRMAELVRRATGVWSDVWSTVEKPTLHAMGGFLVGLAFSSALMTQEALRRLVLAFVPSALSGHLAREVAMAVLLQWEIAVIVAVLAITDLRRRFPADGRDLGRWAAFAAGIAAGCLAVAASVW